MVDRLKPNPTKRIEVSDGMMPALRVVVQPNGAKSYAVRFRQDGRPKKFTIGAEGVNDVGLRPQALRALRTR